MIEFVKPLLTREVPGGAWEIKYVIDKPMNLVRSATKGKYVFEPYHYVSVLIRPYGGDTNCLWIEWTLSIPCDDNDKTLKTIVRDCASIIGRASYDDDKNTTTFSFYESDLKSAVFMGIASYLMYIKK